MPSLPPESPWTGLGTLLLTREWQSFSAIQCASAYFRVVSSTFTDWNYLKSQGGGWLYFRQKLIDPDNPNSILGVTSENRVWLEATPRIFQISEFPDFPDRIPEAFFLPSRRNLDPGKYPRVEIEFLPYTPPQPEPVDLSPLVFPEATNFVYETILVPPGRGTTAALKCAYDRANLEHYGGVFINTSTNIVWSLFVEPGLEAPSKNIVIDVGARINGNGGVLTIPEKTLGDIYFATSSTNEINVRGVYFARNNVSL